LSNGRFEVTKIDGSESDPIIVDLNNPIEIDALANDTPGADGVSYADVLLGDAPELGTTVFDAETGRFTYVPDQGAVGEDSFTYSITDADGDVSEASVLLLLTDLNGTPGQRFTFFGQLR